MGEIKDIYIVGASGSGREVADTIHAINDVSKKYNIVGFIDDDISIHGKIINDIKVIGGISYLKNVNKNNDDIPCAIISIANPDIKENIKQELDEYVYWENIIHPTVVLSKYAELGKGVLLQAQGFIGANVKIGNHVQLNAKSNVSHDSVLNDYVSVMCLCDITGNVTLGKNVYVASGVSVTPGVNVGERAKLGAGSVIMKDVNPGVTMHGYMAVEAKK